MEIKAVKADITTLEVDAIVNAANPAMIIGGGVDGAIHKAAGSDLINYNALHHGFGCPTGMVRVTPGFNLPAEWILHTVGPDMRLYDQDLGDLLLKSCYTECLINALDLGCKSVAFPAISTGVYGFDKARATAIAVNTAYDFIGEDIEIIFACFDDADLEMYNRAIKAKDDRIHFATWSVGNTHYDENDEKVLDLDTEAPDGVYNVVFNYGKNRTGEAHGVTVKDGKFVPEPTLRACAKARNAAGYWGTFLEMLKFYPEDDTEAFFECGFGS